jgi:hypothetical protein
MQYEQSGAQRQKRHKTPCLHSNAARVNSIGLMYFACELCRKTWYGCKCGCTPFTEVQNKYEPDEPDEPVELDEAQEGNEAN